MAINDRVWQRAYRAMICSPFTPKLFRQMEKEGVSLRSIVLFENGYLVIPLSLIAAEDSLLWLIKVGALRREVDGQGITDSFRLTPLGHRLIESFPTEDRFPTAKPIDRLFNFLAQWQPIG